MVPECKPEWKREAITVFSRLPSLRRLQATPPLQNSLKKGTLILQEKPQVIENGSKPSLIYLLNSYNQMNDATQKEFLKLYNRFKDLNEMNEEDKENVKQEMEWLQQNLNFDHKVLQRIQGGY
jgi:hypothetical protein